MHDSLQDRLWTNTSGLETVWTVLWLVLAAVTATLLVLMYTRWGRSRPLEKCALLSLLAHTLMAGISTSIHMAGTAPGHSHEDRAGAVAEFLGELSDGSDSPNGDPAAFEPLGNLPTIDPANDLARASGPSDDPLIRPASATEEMRLAPSSKALDENAALAHIEAATNEELAATRRQAAAEIERPNKTAQAADPPAIADIASPAHAAADQADVPSRSTPAATSIELPTSARIADTAGANLASPTDDETTGLARPTARSTEDGTSSTIVPSRNTIAAASVPFVSSIGSEIDRGAASGHARAGTGDIPDLYKLRTAPNRGQIAIRGGGSAETEAAVEHALAWLASTQSRDGRWNVAQLEGGFEPRTAGHDREGAGIGADTGVTGLALLAFLGSGHTHLKGKYSDNVRLGLEFLINSQNTQGSIAGEARLFARMYCHGMAALALSEALAMTDDARLEPAVHRAVSFTTLSQHGGTGGWRYLPSEQGDMSQHGWQVMLLKSAQLGGVTVSDLTFARASRFVESASSGQRNGLASYRPREKVSSAMTAESFVCKRFLNMRRDEPMADECAAQILTELPSNDRPNFYYWYYGTLAMHDIQGDPWKQWNKAMQQTLLDTQKQSGAASGSWDPDSIWGGYGGRAYSTALGALCMEVYYRYLPIYRVETTARRETSAP